MTLEELENTLPNGLHDSLMLSVHVDYSKAEARLSLEVLISGPEDASEQYRAATLILSGLAQFAIEPAGDNLTRGPVMIDAGSGELPEHAMTKSPSLPKLPDGAFLHWIFADAWNSFIRIVAFDATLVWEGE